MTVLDLITKIHNQKKSKRIVPDHVLNIEILKEFKGTKKEFEEEVNRLVKSGKITWGKTLSNIWFKLI